MDLIENKYKYREIKQVFEKLISNIPELKEHVLKEVDLTNYSIEEDLPYIDVGSISRFVVEKKLKDQTSTFTQLFENVEEIYVNGDDEVKNFIVVGLFEGIQNIGGSKINYYQSFQEWLQPNSRTAWDSLIDSWEGTGWRISKEKQKEINDLLAKKNKR